jgi:hypothetical protein
MMLATQTAVATVILDAARMEHGKHSKHSKRGKRNKHSKHGKFWLNVPDNPFHTG